MEYTNEQLNKELISMMDGYGINVIMFSYDYPKYGENEIECICKDDSKKKLMLSYKGSIEEHRVNVRDIDNVEYLKLISMAYKRLLEENGNDDELLEKLSEIEKIHSVC